MTEQITLEEALEIVTFHQNFDGTWVVQDVKSDVLGNVEGGVWGTINGLKWQFVETPKEKLQRLIEAKGDQELIDAFNQLEDNNND